jgi:hypothetical protein
MKRKKTWDHYHGTNVSFTRFFSCYLIIKKNNTILHKLYSCVLHLFHLKIVVFIKLLIEFANRQLNKIFYNFELFFNKNHIWRLMNTPGGIFTRDTFFSDDASDNDRT